MANVLEEGVAPGLEEVPADPVLADVLAEPSTPGFGDAVPNGTVVGALGMSVAAGRGGATVLEIDVPTCACVAWVELLGAGGRGAGI
ncbi:hypothetical protein YTPLAS18_23980 [Nitrospira sp.]|nr:hypothetical protein YTPLAS18_23980 [Nitrospira sp.]